ncbi:MAG TPA: hypothetical protein VGZ90_13635 [Puia sp.]|jgi:hypothetical protein|nr:hypothetical protein [Puia sp.]
MQPRTSSRLYASGPNKRARYALTNNEDLCEQELRKQGYTSVTRVSDTFTDDLNEIMYFDKQGEIVPTEKLLEKNNYE